MQACFDDLSHRANDIEAEAVETAIEDQVQKRQLLDRWVLLACLEPRYQRLIDAE